MAVFMAKRFESSSGKFFDFEHPTRDPDIPDGIEHPKIIAELESGFSITDHMKSEKITLDEDGTITQYFLDT